MSALHNKKTASIGVRHVYNSSRIILLGQRVTAGWESPYSTSSSSPPCPSSSSSRSTPAPTTSTMKTGGSGSMTEERSSNIVGFNLVYSYSIMQVHWIFSQLQAVAVLIDEH